MAKTAQPGPAAQKVRLFETWPGPVTLRRGWAKAAARPWNQEYNDAHLRIIRGGPGFIAGCAERLFAAGAPSVISIPLPQAASRPWRAAGFEPYLDLALLRLDLELNPPTPDHLVQEESRNDVEGAALIDAEAFEPFWRLDAIGLSEALDATPRSTLLVIKDDSAGLAGFAILGLGHALAYLQRVAVAPRWQRQGMGRSLVRACARKAREGGAGALLLNTQIDNGSALSLYEQEGFVNLSDSLGLLRLAAV